jgi:hypothetical protein
MGYLEQDVENCDCHLQPLTTLSAAEKVALDHTYCRNTSTIDEGLDQNTERPDLKNKLKRGIKSLQQHLRRTKARQQTICQTLYMNCNRNKLYLQRMPI